MFEILTIVFAICFLFGGVYPIICALVYPFYKMLGGKDKFKNYIKNI